MHQQQKTPLIKAAERFGLGTESIRQPLGSLQELISHPHKTGEVVEPARQKGEPNNGLCWFIICNFLLFLSNPFYRKYRKVKTGISYS